MEILNATAKSESAAPLRRGRLARRKTNTRVKEFQGRKIPAYCLLSDDALARIDLGQSTLPGADPDHASGVLVDITPVVGTDISRASRVGVVTLNNPLAIDVEAVDAAFNRGAPQGSIAGEEDAEDHVVALAVRR